MHLSADTLLLQIVQIELEMVAHHSQRRLSRQEEMLFTRTIVEALEREVPEDLARHQDISHSLLSHIAGHAKELCMGLPNVPNTDCT